MTELFDRQLRAVRRDRAARLPADRFLLDRAFDDCLDRLRDIARPFERALVIGCPSRRWVEQLGSFAANVDVVDPGGLFALQAGGVQGEEDRHDFGEDRYDLCLSIGTLDTVNDLPIALQLIGRALRPDGALIGAIAGGNTLAALRAALIEAGRKAGGVVPRSHPRIGASSFAQLLSAAGFSMPVVDVDRVKLRYRDLDGLVRDLRGMAATSILAQRPPPMSKTEARYLREAFLESGSDGRTTETVEILHFLAWRGHSRQPEN